MTTGDCLQAWIDSPVGFEPHKCVSGYAAENRYQPERHQGFFQDKGGNELY